MRISGANCRFQCEKMRFVACDGVFDSLCCPWKLFGLLFLKILH